MGQQIRTHQKLKEEKEDTQLIANVERLIYLIEKYGQKDGDKYQSYISDQAIDQDIDNILANQGLSVTNLIEKKTYHAIHRLILQDLANINIIKLFGHRIQIIINP